MTKRITITRMRNRILVSLLFAGNCLAAFAQDADKTFLVQDGAFPWHDRVDVWVLADVPASLAGAVMPQQSCGVRALNIAGSPASITLAVSAKDLFADGAVEHGDILLAVKLEEGSPFGMTFRPERAAHLRWR